MNNPSFHRKIFNLKILLGIIIVQTLFQVILLIQHIYVNSHLNLSFNASKMMLVKIFQLSIS